MSKELDDATDNLIMVLPRLMVPVVFSVCCSKLGITHPLSYVISFCLVVWGFIPALKVIWIYFSENKQKS